MLLLRLIPVLRRCCMLHASYDLSCIYVTLEERHVPRHSILTLVDILFVSSFLPLLLGHDLSCKRSDLSLRPLISVFALCH